jgi:hypothetical protein
MNNLFAGVNCQLRKIVELLHGVDVTHVFRLADLQHRATGGQTEGGTFRLTKT